MDAHEDGPPVLAGLDKGASRRLVRRFGPRRMRGDDRPPSIPAARFDGLGVSDTRVMVDAASSLEASGVDVSHLEIGQPDVATVHGSSFGPSGRGHVRLSIATDIALRARGLDRIADRLRRSGS